MENDVHSFVLRLPEKLWKEFVGTLPESISANEKLVKLVESYLMEYREAMRGNENAKTNRKN